MSIWSSNPLIGHDPHGDEPGQAVDAVQVRSYANGWSNHYPTTDGTVERAACIDLACIPAWCAGGGDDDVESVGPWLRLGVYSSRHDRRRPSEVVGGVDATVVLNEAAVRALVGQLTDWLGRPKVQPDEPDATADARLELRRVLADRYDVGLAAVDPELQDQSPNQ